MPLVETILFESDFSDHRVGLNSSFAAEVAEEDGNRFIIVPQQPSGWNPVVILDNQRLSFSFRWASANAGSEERLLVTTHHFGEEDGARYHVSIDSRWIGLVLGVRDEGQMLAGRDVTIPPDEWHLFTLTVIDGRFTVELDGETVLEHVPERLPPGMTFLQQQGNSYHVDDVVLAELRP